MLSQRDRVRLDHLLDHTREGIMLSGGKARADLDNESTMTSFGRSSLTICLRSWLCLRRLCHWKRDWAIDHVPRGTDLAACEHCDILLLSLVSTGAKAYDVSGCEAN